MKFTFFTFLNFNTQLHVMCKNLDISQTVRVSPSLPPPHPLFPDSLLTLLTLSSHQTSPPPPDLRAPQGAVVTVCQSVSFSVYSLSSLSDPL